MDLACQSSLPLRVSTSWMLTLRMKRTRYTLNFEMLDLLFYFLYEYVTYNLLVVGFVCRNVPGLKQMLCYVGTTCVWHIL